MAFQAVGFPKPVTGHGQLGAVRTHWWPPPRPVAPTGPPAAGRSKMVAEKQPFFTCAKLSTVDSEIDYTKHTEPELLDMFGRFDPRYAQAECTRLAKFLRERGYIVIDDTKPNCFGLLRGRLVQVVYTPRGADRHIISMRKANDREKARLASLLGL